MNIIAYRNIRLHHRLDDLIRFKMERRSPDPFVLLRLRILMLRVRNQLRAGLAAAVVASPVAGR